MSDAISPALLSEEELEAALASIVEVRTRVISNFLTQKYEHPTEAQTQLRAHIAALEAKLAAKTIGEKDEQAICDLLRQARELERERCAKIAEEHAGFCSNTAGQAAAEAIAAAIRKGGET